MRNDPNEWTNLADRPKSQPILAELRAMLPQGSQQPVEGSRDRILLYDPLTTTANWEGIDIPADAPIPELED
jgi:hypothetical protein